MFYATHNNLNSFPLCYFCYCLKEETNVFFEQMFCIYFHYTVDFFFCHHYTVDYANHILFLMQKL